MNGKKCKLLKDQSGTPDEGSSSQFSESVRYNFIQLKMLYEYGDFIIDPSSIPGLMCNIPVTPNSCY